MEQKTLITRAMKGDHDCFAIAVEQVQDRSYRIAYSYLHDEAASMDAVCDAVEKAFIHIGKLREPEKFATWFTQIVINQCKMQLRKRQPIIYTDDDDSLGFAEVPPSDDLMDLHALMDQLPPMTRTLIQLKYVQGYTLDEIAEMTELPPGTVRTKIYKAVKQIKLSMCPEEKEAYLR
ncbi:sigma-70 family RNA polymerase sigma factor [Paenibacillus sp. ACRRX]|uniref:RNA polymerase sigma factor n=1 Tax=Paenibacillus sp. ACRRX TaxID=2918206 RepID=UPI001EF603BB|nr:sigma-70 family RNA polymerase sigma factor [Paenibacillus sp. ACRRX]MCG7410469.1 sigma-70 family RNA polymerase sigma factor [Paenibacillus sp. ACRRX]